MVTRLFIFETVLLKRGSLIINPKVLKIRLPLHWKKIHYQFQIIINKDLPIQRRFRPKYIENTFKAIQRTFRALEKHSRRRCKICICSVTLGELQSFGNYKGLIIIFPNILDEICRITEVRHFLIPLSIF